MFTVRTKCALGKFAKNEKIFQSIGRTNYHCHQCTFTCRVPKKPLVDQTHSFFVICDQRIQFFEETQKSLQDVIEDFICPGESVQSKCASMSLHRKGLMKAVPNVCNAKRAGTFQIFLYRTKKEAINILFGGGGIFRFDKKTSLEYQNEKVSLFLKKFAPPITLGHVQTSTKKIQMSFYLWHSWFDFSSFDTVNQNTVSILIS